MIVDGWPIYSFMKKLKGLKVYSKGWNKEMLGNIFSRKQVLLDKINFFDMLEESGPFIEDNALEREDCRGALLDLIVKEQKIWMQKCKLQCFLEGEENSSFFHKWVSAHKSKSLISSLMSIDGQALVTEKEIVDEILNFFSSLYGTSVHL